MHDDEYDEEDIDDEDTEVKKPSPDEPVSLVLSGYTARRMDDLVGSHLMSIVRQAVEAKVDKLVSKAIEVKVAAVADEAIRERLENELDICLEEGWQRTDQWGKSCGGGKVTLQDRVVTFLNSGSNKQLGESLLRDVIKRRVQKMVDEYAEALRVELKARVDALVKEKVNADRVVAEQIKQTVATVFDLKL